MNINKILAGLVMAGAAATALAQDGAVGKVDTIYVREAKGLFIEKKLVRNNPSKDLWVNVRLVTGEAASELYKVPAELAIERGDLVAMRDGDPTPASMNLLPIDNKVTQLVARSDTLQAMLFGIPNTGVTKPYSIAMWLNPAN